MSDYQSLNDKLEAFFRLYEGDWIDSDRIAEIAGRCAWRTRISNLRTERGMTIENRQRVIREHADDCPRFQAWDVEPELAPCHCDKPKRWTLSEYCFVAGDDFQLVGEIQEAQAQ